MGTPARSRRRLLQLAGAVTVSEYLGAAPVWAAAAPTGVERKALAAFVDVLIPRDTLSGSATDLRVDARLWGLTQESRPFRLLLESGCRWLDQTGGPPFAELTPQQQVTVVEWMVGSDWNEIPRRFYELVRQTTIELYFSQPAAWQGLPMTRPPQPLGHPLPW